MPLSLQAQGFRVATWRGILTHLGRFEEGQLIPAGKFTDQQLFGMLHAGQIKKSDDEVKPIPHPEDNDPDDPSGPYPDDDDDYDDQAAVTVTASAVQPKRRGSGRRKNAT